MSICQKMACSPNVKSAGVTSTVVEALSGDADGRWVVVGMWARDDGAEEERRCAGAREYIVHAGRVDSRFKCKVNEASDGPRQFKFMAIPNNVQELCDEGFNSCTSLRRVTFGSSSSLERIGVACFKETKVGEVRLPDSVCELCDECFSGCRSLRRVTFGSLSWLERSGVSCFKETKIEEVSIAWIPGTPVLEASVHQGCNIL